MLRPSYTRRFERDLKTLLKRGKEIKKIKVVIRRLIEEVSHDLKYRDHRLIGNYKDRRECHIEPDWLLIYKKVGDEIVFERTGSHTDLFD